MDDWSFCPKCGTKFDPEAKQCSNCGAATPSATTVASGDIPSATDSDLEALESELREALAPGLQLINRLGQGGMGTVFLARDPALKRNVVVKVLSPELAHDPTARARFAREAESAAAVSHPNVINVYSVGELPRSGTSYFVMQHVDGPTLAEEFPEGTAVPETQAKKVIGEVASALAAAHARGLVHRDIKPNNIMIERDSGRAIVLDFGISAAITPEVGATSTKLTVQGTSIGTPQYMSPEQAAGEEVTGASDVYSLGLVAFELVAGRPPFDESNAIALVAAHINKEPAGVSTLRPELDAQLARLIDQCLSKSPQERPTTDELSRALTPPTHATIEWPPPGLEKLRIKSAKFLAALWMTVIVVLAISTLTALQPISLSPQWYGEEDQFFWRIVSAIGAFSTTDASGVIGQLWLISLWSSWLLLVAMAAALLLRGSAFTRSLTWSRKSGYSWAVLADLVIDTGEDTEGVLNRSGLFASLSTGEADRFIKLRRWAGFSKLLGLGLGFLAPALWLLGYIGGLMPHGTRILPLVEAALVLGPTLLMLALSVALRTPERLHHRRIGSRRKKGKSLVRRELVDTWLASVGRPPRTRVSGLATFLTAPIPSLLASSVTFLLLVLIVVGLAVAAVQQSGLGENRSVAQQWLRMRRGQMPWYRLDSAVQAAALPVGVNDSAAFVTMTTVALSGVLRVDPQGNRKDERDRIWAVDARTQVAQEDRKLVADPVLASLWKNGLRDIPDTMMALLEHDTTTQWLELFRRAARSTVPSLWQLRDGFPGGTAGAWLVPATEARGYRTGVYDLATRNEEAALLQLAARDWKTAELRAREIISVGRHFLIEPLEWMSWIGARLIVRGARVLSRVGEASTNATMVAEGARLEELFDTDDDVRGRGRWSGMWVGEGFLASRAVGRLLMVDPVDPPGLAAIADRRLAPFVRWELVRLSLMAHCANPREYRFGIDPLRLTVLDSAVVLAADIPRVAELGEMLHREYERILAMPFLERFSEFC